MKIFLPKIVGSWREVKKEAFFPRSLQREVSPSHTLWGGIYTSPEDLFWLLIAWRRGLPHRGALWFGFRMKVTNFSSLSRGCFLSFLRTFPRGRNVQLSVLRGRSDRVGKSMDRRLVTGPRYCLGRLRTRGILSILTRLQASCNPDDRETRGWDRPAEHQQQGCPLTSTPLVHPCVLRHTQTL